MHDPYLLLTPLLVFGVVGLVGFVGCDLVFGVSDFAEPFITDQVLGSPRNNYSGFSGMAIDVGSKPLTIRRLGRYCVAGSTGDHRIQIIDADTGSRIQDGLAVVSLAGKPDGFVSAKLDPVVTLVAGKRYYIVSEEVDGGDRFFDNDTAVIAASVATVVSPVYFDAVTAQWTLLGLPGHSYGPVQFHHGTARETYYSW